MVDVFPRIQHPKVRGGGVGWGSRAYQPSSALACVQWQDQSLEGQGFIFSAPIVHAQLPEK